MQRLSRLVAENGERYYLLSKQDEGRPHDIQLVVTDGCDVWEKISKRTGGWVRGRGLVST